MTDDLPPSTFGYYARLDWTPLLFQPFQPKPAANRLAYFEHEIETIFS